MNDLVNVSKITIQINDKEIELTMREAKMLKNVLDDTFEGVKPMLVEREYVPVYPWWGERTYPCWKVICGSGTDASMGTATVSDNLIISSC